jgi:hypothetical protein
MSASSGRLARAIRSAGRIEVDTGKVLRGQRVAGTTPA